MDTKTPGGVFAVLSGAGGAGKSVIAANLAVALARTSGKRVVLVDLSLQFGDIAAILNLKTESHLAELAMKDLVGDAEAVAAALVPGPEGLQVLLAPPTPELADYVTGKHLRAVVEELRKTFGFVIIDTPNYLNDVTLDAFEIATGIVMVTDFSVASVKNVRLALSVMDSLKVSRERVVLVANNHRGTGKALDRAGIEAHLRLRIAVELPYDPKIVDVSINSGLPFVVGTPQSHVAQGVSSIAEHVIALSKGPMAHA